MEEWKNKWTESKTAQKAGGQGHVIKVQKKDEKTFGALKRLHEQSLKNSERRYRLKQEADALRFIDGNGTPKLLEANDHDWQKDGHPLYLILEWLEGPTLSEFCGGKALDVSSSITIVKGLVKVIGKLHKAGILHRDLKPDNIILLNGDIARPYVVDFGISWTHPPADVPPEFETPAQQELGNRFLRLPELAPAGDHRDERSDLTMAIGILLYLLTGHAPRLLQNQHGKKPHETLSEHIPPATSADSRWAKLVRIFNIGFNHDIELRFSSAEQLMDYLERTEKETNGDSSDLSKELAELENVLDSEMSRKEQQLTKNMMSASQRFLETVQKNMPEKIAAGGSGPNFIPPNVDLQFFLQRQGAVEPKVWFNNRICVVEGQYVASYWTDFSVPSIYYKGPIGDPDSLIEASVTAANKLSRELLQRFKERLDSHFREERK